MIALWCWHSGYWLLRRGWSLQHTSGMRSAFHCGGSDFGYWCWRGIWLKVLVESGVGSRLTICSQMTCLCYQPHLLLPGSACIAGSAITILTTGGLLSEAVMGLDPIQCVLATLAASLWIELGVHINDTGFWIGDQDIWGCLVADGLKPGQC